MTNKELVIHVTSAEVNIALLEDKQLVELNKEKKESRFTVGDIYLARVKKIMPGLNAAFVDVGYERDAFLHYLDLGPQFQSFTTYIDYVFKKGKVAAFQRFKGKPDIDKKGKITRVLREGQKILVQIAKEPIANKGPRLSSEISIAGRHLVLLPFSDKVSVSQKIESSEERMRLKQLIRSIRPHNFGVIVRTVAEGKKVAQLDAELKQLSGKWESALEHLRSIRPPGLLLSEMSRTTSILRDMLSGSFSQITVDDETVVEEIREYIEEIAPEKKKIVKHYTGKVNVFEYMGIDKQIKTLFGRTVPFRNGAYLILEHTEALHVIDVNSGNIASAGIDQESNALSINLTAAQEIARQLRLRDIGGIIVIDFIDMVSNENKQQVFERMKEYMSQDRAKHSILPLSRFGLMQITRQRVRPEMNIKTVEKCPVCRGTGESIPSILFVDELENKVKSITAATGIKYLEIKTHPFIEAYITRGIFTIRRQWQRKYHCRMKITANPSVNLNETEFYDREGNEIKV